MKKMFFIFLLIPVFAVAQNHEEANYDEDRIPPYSLPEVLVTNSGERVTSVEGWENKRRGEILELFRNEVYGNMPDDEVEVSYKILENGGDALGGKAVRRQVEMTFCRNGVERNALLLLYLPAGTAKAPIFLHFNFQGNQTVAADSAIVASQYSRLPRGNQTNRWPVEMIIDAGYGLATVHYSDFYLDRKKKSGVESSIFPLFGYDSLDSLPDNGAQAIGAWAWGYSRVMDYLETADGVDAGKVAVAGHSRLGKASLWAGALDERFAVVISNDSGCGGAALSMRRIGETVNEITKIFPHWFCRNFWKYKNNEDALPVDQHQLLSLIAPRPVYVASAEDDRWADPRGEYLSLYHASPVYGLYGKKGFGTKEMPAVNEPRMADVGYHIRSGKHDVTDFDWQSFIAFCNRFFR